MDLNKLKNLVMIDNKISKYTELYLGIGGQKISRKEEVKGLEGKISYSIYLENDVVVSKIEAEYIGNNYISFTLYDNENNKIDNNKINSVDFIINNHKYRYVTNKSYQLS